MGNGHSWDFPSKIKGDKGNPQWVTGSLAISGGVGGSTSNPTFTNVATASADVFRAVGPTTASLILSGVTTTAPAAFGPLSEGEWVNIGADVDVYYRFAPDSDTALLTSASNGKALAGMTDRDWEVPTGYTYLGMISKTVAGTGSVNQSSP